MPDRGHQVAKTTLMEIAPAVEEIVRCCEEDGSSYAIELYDERILVWQFDEGEPTRAWWTRLHSARLGWKPVDLKQGRYFVVVNRSVYYAPKPEAIGETRVRDGIRRPTDA